MLRYSSAKKHPKYVYLWSFTFVRIFLRMHNGSNKIYLVYINYEEMNTKIQFVFPSFIFLGPIPISPYSFAVCHSRCDGDHVALLSMDASQVWRLSLLLCVLASVLQFRINECVGHRLTHICCCGSHSVNIFVPNNVRRTDWTAINQMECKECAHSNRQKYCRSFSHSFVLFVEAKHWRCNHIAQNCDYDENNDDDCQINVVVHCKSGDENGRLPSWPHHFSDEKLFAHCLKNGQTKALRTCSSVKKKKHCRMAAKRELFIFIALFKWLMVNALLMYSNLISQWIR